MEEHHHWLPGLLVPVPPERLTRLGQQRQGMNPAGVVPWKEKQERKKSQTKGRRSRYRAA